jgi:colicin import membrane protein
MTAATPYSIPQEPGRWRAIVLAVMVHAALLAFLWIGVRWQNETPVAVEAEVWDLQTHAAAPLPKPVAAPEPEPEPEPEPAPAPAPKPVVKAPPKPVVEVPVAKPDITLEQEKKRKAHEKKQQEEEQLAKLKQKAEQVRQAKLKAEQDERLAKQKKAEEERLAKIETDKRLEKEKADKAKKLAEAKHKQQEADDKAMAKIRAEEMRRITSGVTGSGGSGDAPKSTGNNRADASYIQKVGARIKSNTAFNTPDGLTGNPTVEYRVELLPDGSLRGLPRKLKSSGVPGFDEAVQRAIEKSAPFPADKSGAVPSGFIVSHKPKD